ncbi:hypothetical protein SAMN05444920_103874 [Nonomuraea solani]|uniref:Sigma-70 region 2 n=1 Tax=Nonomuraea solani TaxID=1144553 RepID=A0A1H6C4A7_9ACTN|nr:hypothetical protein [Nonomuraea solani]SEG67465.1 hypothetical protein SAMN05444920_103874 [Nonomuraea solani]
MDPGFEAALRQFVIDRSGALFRTAYPLTGDRHAAEDLVQPALTKTAARWPEAIEGYVRRTMHHEQVSWCRRPRPASPEARMATINEGWRAARLFDNLSRMTGRPEESFAQAAKDGRSTSTLTW